MRAWRRGGADPAARRAAEDRGRAAEARAVLWLRLKGYRVLGRRIRTPVGEIDLMVRRGDLVCFVEVKARTRLEDALAAVSETQRRRIERAAAYLMANRSELRGKDLRFDVLAVTPVGRPRHVVDAWRPSAALF